MVLVWAGSGEVSSLSNLIAGVQLPSGPHPSFKFGIEFRHDLCIIQLLTNSIPTHQSCY